LKQVQRDLSNDGRSVCPLYSLPQLDHLAHAGLLQTIEATMGSGHDLSAVALVAADLGL
jgi:hypothetical protein